MAARISYDEVDVGTALPSAVFTIRRRDLLRYAAASGDHNPVHFDRRAALDAGLPDIIGHGMLTMAFAGRVVTDWLGDPGAVAEFGARFSRPTVVPDDTVGPAASIAVGAQVIAKEEDKRVRIALTVVCDGVSVLGAAYAVVRLS